MWKYAVAGVLAAVVLGVLGAGARAELATCRDDAMIVFDASGSMAGTDLNSPPTPRIARVKEALGKVLPGIASYRKLGLVDYGPGSSPNQCDNIELQLEPVPDAAGPIMAVVERLIPVGRTPLTSAVRLAAKVVGFPARPAVVVLLTDGEETCGGDPCGLARELKANGEHLTVHVIGYRNSASDGMGYLQSRCLAEATGGLYISVETTDELVAAFHKTLGCPTVSRADGP
jgi:Ca-activated chloride channel family protein